MRAFRALSTPKPRGLFDDVELLYEGEADKLKVEHEEALAEDLKRRQAQWKKEAKQWEARINGDAGS